MRRQPSLKRPLILQPLIVQLMLSLATFGAFVAFILRMDAGGAFAEEDVAAVAANAIVRQADGLLAVRPTPDLAKLRRETGDLWFVARDDRGRTISYGSVPALYASLGASLGNISFAELRGEESQPVLSAVIRRHESAAGPLTILAHGKVRAVTLVVALFSNLVILPIFVILGLVTVIATPVIVNRSLRGVARIAREAEAIDADRRGVRLSVAQVPREIEPLVRAVNDALERLDEGHHRQSRFIASAAHELRTPIAILQVKIEASDLTARRRLSGDIARLANLAEQLLDLHRLDDSASREEIDLATLARRVAADMAPLLIVLGKTIEVRVEEPRPILGDMSALERVMTNLVQNAVQHGGGEVIVRTFETAFEVEDDGPGIPHDQREQVFEPFHRVVPRQTGAGLGLNLVRQVIQRHGGHITILDAPSGGTIVRVSFPQAGGRRQMA